MESQKFREQLELDIDGLKLGFKELYDLNKSRGIKEMLAGAAAVAASTALGCYGKGYSIPGSILLSLGGATVGAFAAHDELVRGEKKKNSAPKEKMGENSKKL